MSRRILYMAMSLDGFITGPGDDRENPAGVAMTYPSGWKACSNWRASAWELAHWSTGVMNSTL
jgi:hypothetical protein